VQLVFAKPQFTAPFLEKYANFILVAFINFVVANQRFLMRQAWRFGCCEN